MPTSRLEVAPRLINLVHTTPRHETVLDVGPGWGKYATLLREYLNEPPVEIDCVEAWPPYVTGHRLTSLYEQVFIGDAAADTWIDVTRAGRDVDAGEQLASYDVVLMVDVIEHMDKQAALALLDRIPGWIVVGTPETFFHNGDGLPPTEAHVSAWHRDDFVAAAASGGRMLEYVGKEWGAWLIRLGPRPGFWRHDRTEKVHRVYT